MANLVEKSEKSKHPALKSEQETLVCEKLEIVSDKLRRVPSFLALADSNTKNFPDAFSRELYEKSMMEIRNYFENPQDYPEAKPIDMSEIRVGVDGILFKNLSENDKKKYLSYLFSLGQVRAQLTKTKWAILNIFGILVLDETTNKVSISVKKKRIYEAIIEEIQKHEISLKDEQKLKEEYTNIFSEYDGYLIPGIGYFKNEKKAKQSKGFYDTKILYHCFRHSKTGYFLITLERLQKNLGLENKEFHYFNNNILQQAKKNLNTSIDWLEFDYEKIMNKKDKRKVESIVFYFRPFIVKKKDNKELDIQTIIIPSKYEAVFVKEKNKEYVISEKEEKIIEKQDYESLLHARMEKTFLDCKRKMGTLFNKELYNDFELKAQEMKWLYSQQPYEIIQKNWYQFYCRVQSDSIGNILYEKVQSPKGLIMSILGKYHGFLKYEDEKTKLEKIPELGGLKEKMTEFYYPKAKVFVKEFQDIVNQEIEQALLLAKEQLLDIAKIEEYASKGSLLKQEVNKMCDFVLIAKKIKIPVSSDMFHYLVKLSKKYDWEYELFTKLGDDAILEIYINDQENIKLTINSEFRDVD